MASSTSVGHSEKAVGPDRRVLVSTLWIFVMVNMLAADIFSFMVPGSLAQIQAGDTGMGPISLGFLLAAAVLIEIPILMIVLSRVLRHRANRLAQIIASVVTIPFVAFGGSLYPHYIFFATVEVVCMVLIIGLAWTWRSSEGIR